MAHHNSAAEIVLPTKPMDNAVRNNSQEIQVDIITEGDGRQSSDNSHTLCCRKRYSSCPPGRGSTAMSGPWSF
ncbi:hypothetical protein A2U01_0074440, partial [Trifolium medium]|nr:hypothetical protein [Trifolium medium]